MCVCRYHPHRSQRADWPNAMYIHRYQYLSLVHFLEAGTWEEEKEEGARAAAPQGQGGQHYGRSVTYRDGWGEDWNSFYRLTAESLGGHEVLCPHAWLNECVVMSCCGAGSRIASFTFFSSPTHSFRCATASATGTRPGRRTATTVCPSPLPSLQHQGHLKRRRARGEAPPPSASLSSGGSAWGRGAFARARQGRSRGMDGVSTTDQIDGSNPFHVSRPSIGATPCHPGAWPISRR